MTVDKASEKIEKMFDSIADEYDRNNNIISLGLHSLVKTLAIKELDINNNYEVLDLCCGTGDIISILIKQNKNLNITGVDFSEEMLKFAKHKLAGQNVNLLKEDVSSLPFENSRFNTVTMFFGLRNVENRQKVINEIYRILKPEGEFLHMDFGVKNIFSRFFDSIAITGIKMFYKNKSAYEYLIESKHEFPRPEIIIEEFVQAGFRLKKKKDFLFGIISMQMFSK